jgi:hypothetical protein
MDAVRRLLFKKGTRRFREFNCFPGWDARAGKQLHRWVRGTEHFSPVCQSRTVSNAERVVGANSSANIPHVCLLVSEAEKTFRKIVLDVKYGYCFSQFLFVRFSLL